jgi:DNA-binding NarL/FixJ family response regulator
MTEAADAPVRVLVVDDDALVRAGLRLMLGGASGIEVVGEAADGSEVPDAVAKLSPDVLLMDIRMPGVDGLAATRALRARPGAPEVVVLTTFDADEQVIEALRVGAAGFLLKDTPPAEIVKAVKAVAAGDAMLSPAVTKRLIGHLAGDIGAERRREARARLESLTGRELDVAIGLGRGLPNAEIAAATYMSVATVKAHVSRLMVKLGLTNRVQVALLAHDAELTGEWPSP